MISVCIVCHNGEKYIRQQIESILPQLGSEDEVIVSDDGSTDKTLEIVSNLNDKRVKIVRCNGKAKKRNGIFGTMQKISQNVENALKNASGDVIFLSDQDDVWCDNKVNIVLEHLKNCDCVVHDCFVVDDSLKFNGITMYQFIKPKNTFIGTLYRSSFMGCCMAFNKSILQKSLPFPQYPIEHDTWIGINSLSFGRVKHIQEKLIYYRRHFNNVSPCAEGSKNSLAIKILRRLYMLLAIMDVNVIRRFK